MQNIVDNILSLPNFYFHDSDGYKSVHSYERMHCTHVNITLHTCLSTFTHSLLEEENNIGHHQLVTDDNLVKGYFIDVDNNNKCYLYDYNVSQGVCYFWLLEQQDIELWLHGKTTHINMMKGLYRLVVVNHNINSNSYTIYQSHTYSYSDYQYIMDDEHKSKYCCDISFVYFHRVKYWWVNEILYLHIANIYSDYYEEEENFIHIIKHGNMSLKKTWCEKYHGNEDHCYYNQHNIAAWYAPVDFDQHRQDICWIQQCHYGNKHGWSVNHKYKRLCLYHGNDRIEHSWVTMFLGLYVLTRDNYIICNDSKVNRFLSYFDKLPPEIGELILSKIVVTHQCKINKFFTAAGIDIILYSGDLSCL